MTTTTLTNLLYAAGVLHIGLIWAGATMPHAVNLGEHIRVLPVFIRRLFITYFVFIGLMLAAFGTLTVLFAPAIAAGEPLARALATWMLLVWLIRLAVAVFVFDVRPYLRTSLYRLGYHATNAAFLYLVLVYAIAVYRGGAL